MCSSWKVPLKAHVVEENEDKMYVLVRNMLASNLCGKFSLIIIDSNHCKKNTGIYIELTVHALPKKIEGVFKNSASSKDI